MNYITAELAKSLLSRKIHWCKEHNSYSISWEPTNQCSEWVTYVSLTHIRCLPVKHIPEDNSNALTVSHCTTVRNWFITLILFVNVCLFFLNQHLGTVYDFLYEKIKFCIIYSITLPAHIISIPHLISKKKSSLNTGCSTDAES